MTYFSCPPPGRACEFSEGKNSVSLVFNFLMSRITQGTYQVHLNAGWMDRWTRAANAMGAAVFPPQINVPPAQTLSLCRDASAHISLLPSECGTHRRVSPHTQRTPWRQGVSILIARPPECLKTSGLMRMRRQAADGEKMFTKHTSDKELVSKTHRELLTLNSKKGKQMARFKKWARDLNRCLTEGDIQMAKSMWKDSQHPV